MLFEQLTTRRLEWGDKGRLRAEPKDAMSARGIKSPDRADAYIGAIMAGHRLTGAVSASSFCAPDSSDNQFGGFVGGF